MICLEKELMFLKEKIPFYFKKSASLKPEDVSRKTAFDLVTNVDKNIENDLIADIHEFFPTDNIIAEESLKNGSLLNRTWTIDPIDGTVNMANGIKLHGTQVSLSINSQIVLSYIYLPYLNDEYWALDGEGAFHNNVKISTHKARLLNDSLVSFGDYSHDNEVYGKRQHMAISEIYPIVSKIRMFGSAAIDFALVASGSTQACVVITKNIWDIFPGIFLCQTAGLLVTSLDGTPYNQNSEGVIACCGKELLTKLIDSLKKAGF